MESWVINREYYGFIRNFVCSIKHIQLLMHSNMVGQAPGQKLGNSPPCFHHVNLAFGLQNLNF